MPTKYGPEVYSASERLCLMYELSTGILFKYSLHCTLWLCKQMTFFSLLIQMYYIAVSYYFIMVMFSAARCTPGATSKAWTLSLGRKEWLHWRLNALWCGTLSWVRPPQNKARMYSRVKPGSGYCPYLSLWLAYAGIRPESEEIEVDWTTHWDSIVAGWSEANGKWPYQTKLSITST